MNTTNTVVKKHDDFCIYWVYLLALLTTCHYMCGINDYR